MRNFIVTVTVFTIATCVNAAGADVNLFKAEDYAELRKELRAFYPDECHDLCKDPSYAVSEKAINDDLDAYAASHPGYDALEHLGLDLWKCVIS